MRGVRDQGSGNISCHDARHRRGIAKKPIYKPDMIPQILVLSKEAKATPLLPQKNCYAVLELVLRIQPDEKSWRRILNFAGAILLSNVIPLEGYCFVCIKNFRRKNRLHSQLPTYPTTQPNRVNRPLQNHFA